MSLLTSSTVQLDIENFQSKVELNKKQSIEVVSKYTTKYRVIKTCLLISAWIAFGLNNELIGSAYEDLRILLELDYNGISTAQVVKSIGMLTTMFFTGVLYDNMKAYTDLLMAISFFTFNLGK